MCLISMYGVLNTLSEYTYFAYQKTLHHTLFCLFLKPLKAFSVSLIKNTSREHLSFWALKVPLIKENVEHSLHEKCPNTELFLVHIFLYSDWIRRDSPYLSVFSPNTGKYGPEITPYFDTFHAVSWYWSYFLQNIFCSNFLCFALPDFLIGSVFLMKFCLLC